MSKVKTSGIEKYFGELHLSLSNIFNHPPKKTMRKDTLKAVVLLGINTKLKKVDQELDKTENPVKRYRLLKVRKELIFERNKVKKQ